MEVYNLPIKLREWFVKRLARQKEEESEAMKAASAGKSSARAPTQLGEGSAPPSMPDPSK
tara:strand:+ start:787 stop:966 length:180 start_codon:yes stop_codon:yes gene_type:complete